MDELNSYNNAQASLKKFLGLKVNAMQIHRLTSNCGQAAGQLEKRKAEKPQSAEGVYVQPDGSMVLTRTDGWNEVKVGRTFSERDYIKEAQVGQGWIKNSNCEAVIDEKNTFSDVFERQLETSSTLAGRLIFITDGTTWIRNGI